MRNRGTVCLLVVPLLARGEVIGTIGIPTNSQEIFNQDEVMLAQTIASQVASVIDNARLHQSVKQARDAAERELEIGRQIQTSFFPESLPRLSGWNLGAHFISARQVAGDFYDLFPLGKNRIALVLADVCDKGVGAALFMVLFRSLLRSHVQRGFSPDHFSDPDQMVVDPGEMVVSAVLETNNYVAINHARANMFATVFAAIVEGESDSLWYVNCGHDAPVLVRKSGQHERLGSTGAAIGMFPDLKISAGFCEIHTGDSLFAFTDGVTDARAPDGTSFGEERLMPLLLADRSLEHRLNTLNKALTAHIGEGDQYDDITFIGIQRI
jgi:sigma-B regulation protein RsbU (phosphoserine phosphatase)